MKLKKKHYIPGLVLMLIILLAAIAPPVAKQYLQNHSEEMIGRKITLDRLKINYFRCSISLRGFAMFEQNKQDTFVAFDRFYLNFSPWKLLRHEYAVSALELTDPTISIARKDSLFNFSDLIPPDDSTDTDTTSSTTKYSVKNLRISGGAIRYSDLNSGDAQEVCDLGIELPEIAWNSRQADVGLSFTLGAGGQVALRGSVNPEQERYNMEVDIKHIDLQPFASFAKPWLAVQSLEGLLDTRLHLAGSLQDPLDLVIRGGVALSRFKATDPAGKPICAIRQLEVALDSISLVEEQYHIASVVLDHPEITYTMDRESNTLDRLLAPLYEDVPAPDTSGAGATAGDSTVADTPSEMHYSIRNLAIRNGSVQFTDLTLNRPFTYPVTAIEAVMTGFSDLGTAIPVNLSMMLDQAGSFKGELVMDMRNPDNLSFKGVLNNLSLSRFSPYSEYWIARPVTGGTFHYKGDLKMTPTQLSNKNHIHIAGLETGRKTGDTTAYRVPVGLALYVLKDRHDMITFDLPVSGNPSAPNFRLGKIILKTLEEFLIKTAAAPFTAMARSLGMEGEDLESLKFWYLQDTLDGSTQNRLGRIAEISGKKPELTFTFIQTGIPDREIEMVAFRILRDEYLSYLQKQGNTGATPESIRLDDPAFLEFCGLSAGIPDTGTLLDRAGREKTMLGYRQILTARQTAMKNFLTAKGMPEKAVLFRTADVKAGSDQTESPGYHIEISLN
ncbi:MAG TPA: DUF748 domain-containing protein [Bacteroidales bacterium]|nr:DUF748 domain-containing protein [Bacteroidales bacterium]HRZ48832.1 DUF748 domain-containing protein [Bacteroidales bacterium]